MEVHPEERREQDEAHEQRQDGVKYRLHYLAHRVKRGCPIKYEIDDRARHNRAGQGPIFQKSNDGLHSDGKITTFLNYREGVDTFTRSLVGLAAEKLKK